MALIFESPHFTVESADKPLIDRNDGGHITINPRINISDRQNLSPSQAIELMRLSIVTGQAMSVVMNKHGVDIGRINYQDNGNWSVFHPDGPKLHLHIYGRAKSARFQKYGQACFFPHKNEHPEFYETLQALTETDVDEIGKEIIRLLAIEKFASENWKLDKEG